MKPVWIRYWGLIPMTRRGYLVTLTLTAAVAAIVVAFVGLAGYLPPLSTLWEHDPRWARRGLAGIFYNYLWWVLIVCLAAQAIDTVMVLRRFRQKEAEQRRQEAVDQGAQT